MKLKIISYFFLFVISALMLMIAGKYLYVPTPIVFKIPPGFPKPPTNIFTKNKLTEEGFQLGKNYFMMAGSVKTAK